MIAALPGADLAGHALGVLRAGLTAPASHRIALLAVGALQDLGLDRIALMAKFGDRLSFQHLAAACDCCVAGPVVSVTLGRLLRQGPFENLLVLADARTHLEGLERTLAAALGRITPLSSEKSSVTTGSSATTGSSGATVAPGCTHGAARIERVGLMTDPQRLLLTDSTRAGHQAALDLMAWAGPGMSFVGQA